VSVTKHKIMKAVAFIARSQIINLVTILDEKLTSITEYLAYDEMTTVLTVDLNVLRSANEAKLHSLY